VVVVGHWIWDHGICVHKKYWEKVLRDKQLMAGKKVEYAPES